MSATIDLAFVEQFESLVHHLGQQEMSRLWAACRKKFGTAEKYNFERLASEDMIAKVSRHEATPILDVEHSRRVATVSTFKWADAVDSDDDVQVLIDPESEYVKNAGMAHGRQTDNILISALRGVATDGAGATTALPAGQIVGNPALAFLVANLIEASELLNAAEVMGDRFFAIKSSSLRQLLGDTTLTSADFNTVKALVSGEVDTFMGFKFIRTELLPEAISVVDNIAWAQPALGLGVSEERRTRIAEDPSLSFATRIYMELVMGAVRIEDAGVVVSESLATA